MLNDDKSLSREAPASDIKFLETKEHQVSSPPSPIHKSPLKRWVITAAILLLSTAGFLSYSPARQIYRSMDNNNNGPPPSYDFTEKNTPYYSSTMASQSSPSQPTSSSRSTIIDHSGSNSISGSYELLDLLSLRSTSGSIDVTVSPGPASKNDPDHPAKFTADTSSGSIRTTFLSPAGGKMIPARDYQTAVSSSSGSIRGTYILGTSTDFRTSSGSITISLLSGGGGGGKSAVLGCHSVSGSVTVQAPADFEGTIRAETTSGSINVGGAGVKIVKDVNAPGSRYVEATKGSGGSGSITVGTTSGRVKITVL